ncbi:unnamed protein product [Amaranthus hypochondriacus]
MGRPHKNPQNSSSKAKKTVTQHASRSSSAISGSSLKPIEEGYCSNAKSDSMAEEVERMKSLVESLSRKTVQEQSLSQFDVRLDSMCNTQSQEVGFKENQSTVPAQSVVNSELSNQQFLVPEGMQLNFVSPSIANSVYRAIVDKEEVSSLKLKWQATCVMFVVGFRLASLSVLNTYIKNKWPSLGNFTSHLHEDGYFLVKCRSESDVHEILKGGNTMIGKRPILIRKWDENFYFKRDILRVVPVWVRLQHLPTEF